MRTIPTAERTEFTLKPISKDSIGPAIEKAEQYRLLNQPRLAESICNDVLLVESGNQRALVMLLLALTDQFGNSSSTAARKAQDIANRLTDNYSRIYYTGIIRERQGTACMTSRNPGSEFDAYEWYMEAMDLYEQADAANQDSKNDDPTLRWNTCARIIMENSLKPRPQGDDNGMLE